MEWAWGSHSLGAGWRGMDEAGRGVSLKDRDCQAQGGGRACQEGRNRRDGGRIGTRTEPGCALGHQGCREEREHRGPACF